MLDTEMGEVKSEIREVIIQQNKLELLHRKHHLLIIDPAKLLKRFQKSD